MDDKNHLENIRVPRKNLLHFYPIFHSVALSFPPIFFCFLLFIHEIRIYRETLLFSYEIEFVLCSFDFSSGHTSLSLILFLFRCCLFTKFELVLCSLKYVLAPIFSFLSFISLVFIRKFVPSRNISSKEFVLDDIYC